MEVNEPTVQGNKLPEHLKSLIIIFDTKTQEMQLNGPIIDKILCYGMLEMAKECLQHYHRDLLTKQKEDKNNIPGVITP